MGAQPRPRVTPSFDHTKWQHQQHGVRLHRWPQWFTGLALASRCTRIAPGCISAAAGRGDPTLELQDHPTLLPSRAKSAGSHPRSPPDSPPTPTLPTQFLARWSRSSQPSIRMYSSNITRNRPSDTPGRGVLLSCAHLGLYHASSRGVLPSCAHLRVQPGSTPQPCV